jgi:predicted nucleotide-binding protein (sugar kinase/HSP70/actin superfamily)
VRASFPRFGYDTFALKTFVEELGADVVLPPENSRRTLELGVLHSPELICLPYKITLGNMIEAAEAGADTILMAAGARKCRFGYYHYLQDRALKHLGFNCRLIPIVQYSPLESAFRVLPALFGVSPARVIRATALMVQKSYLTQRFRELLNRKRAVDFDGAEADRKAAMPLLDSVRGQVEIRRARYELERRFRTDGKRPVIKLALVGEIYFMIEQFASQEIEKELARMGVEVLFERSLYRHLRHLLAIDPKFARSARLAKQYLAECPGGEAHRTVGEAVHFSRNGVDGIVHIFPFTCMPENMALEALEQLSSETGVPVLSLSFDEHTSRTGLLTRLEAFVDLVKRRKTRTGKNRIQRSETRVQSVGCGVRTAEGG